MIIFYLRLDHLVYDVAPQTNPIKLSCYMDEDAVGKLKKLAMASSPQNMGEYVEHLPPKNGNTNETAEHGDPQPTTFPSQPLVTW